MGPEITPIQKNSYTFQQSAEIPLIGYIGGFNPLFTYIFAKDSGDEVLGGYTIDLFEDASFDIGVGINNGLWVDLLTTYNGFLSGIICKFNNVDQVVCAFYKANVGDNFSLEINFIVETDYLVRTNITAPITDSDNLFEFFSVCLTRNLDLTYRLNIIECGTGLFNVIVSDYVFLNLDFADIFHIFNDGQFYYCFTISGQLINISSAGITNFVSYADFVSDKMLLSRNDNFVYYYKDNTVYILDIITGQFETVQNMSDLSFFTVKNNQVYINNFDGFFVGKLINNNLGSYTNNLTVKNAISLSCFSPCRPLIINKGLI